MGPDDWGLQRSCLKEELELDGLETVLELPDLSESPLAAGTDTCPVASLAAAASNGDAALLCKSVVLTER